MFSITYKISQHDFLNPITSLLKMGTGLDRAMDRKIPARQWKAQLLKLVNEAPKAVCVECESIHFQRFPNSSSASDDSDQSVQSSGNDFITTTTTTNNSTLLNTSIIRRHRRENGDGASADMDIVNGLGVMDGDIDIHSLGLDDLGLDLRDTTTNTSSCSELDRLTLSLRIDAMCSRGNDETDAVDSHSIPNSHSSQRHCTHCQNCNTSVSLSTDVWDEGPLSGGNTNGHHHNHNSSIKSAGEDCSSYNPFGKAFHGYLTHSRTQQLLTKDGYFLIRKRDNDDEFVLSFRFNGHTKNYIVSYDDTTGLLYVGDRSKAYDNIQELVQEGLVTLSLDMKAGSYIDLMCDLIHFNNGHQNNHHSINSRTNGHLKSTTTYGGVGQKCQYNHHTKQNSPSPSVSSLSKSSMEKKRNPDLRTHSFHVHNFEGLSKCQICENFMWGLSSQGLRCKDCEFSIHTTCEERVVKECEPRLSQLVTIFGGDLTPLVKAAGVSRPPFVLEKCITEIETRGLHIEGIYRVSGAREMTERLKTYLEQERENADMSQNTDIHSMCGLVKLYLRLLPQPLITPEVFQRFLTADGGQLTVDTIRRSVKKLPPAHQITLKYLLQHLHRVSNNSERNKMNAFNLSSVFTPSVMQISLTTLKIGTTVLEMMITNVPNLYSKT